MNPDGSYTLPEAARTVARLKTMLGPPYRIVGHAEEGPGTDPNTLMARLKRMPADVEGQTFQNFEEMLKVFREHHPEGMWLLYITGVTPGYSKPAGFIDTPIIEKALEWHKSQGHPGTI